MHTKRFLIVILAIFVVAVVAFVFFRVVGTSSPLPAATKLGQAETLQNPSFIPEGWARSSILYEDGDKMEISYPPHYFLVDPSVDKISTVRTFTHFFNFQTNSSPDQQTGPKYWIALTAKSSISPEGVAKNEKSSDKDAKQVDPVIIGNHKGWQVTYSDSSAVRLFTALDLGDKSYVFSLEVSGSVHDLSDENRKDMLNVYDLMMRSVGLQR